MIARVFPRRTAATPTDDLAFVGGPPLFLPDGIREVHLSVAFTWDLPVAERLAREWARVAPVQTGGPAVGTRGEAFVPGQYLAPGYVITSRGCPNRCWFCSVWRREGRDVRELPVCEGWNVLDDNLLACSETHVRKVFGMLSHYPGKTVQFTGGLEAARLLPWHAEQLHKVRPRSLYFAYDTPDDLEPLCQAGKLLKSAGFRPGDHDVRCYVLCGYPRDTFDAADRRMRETIDAGFFPMAMLYRDQGGRRDPAWARFQRHWARPQIVAARLANGGRQWRE